MIVYPKSSLSQIGNVGHPVFKYVEGRFNSWISKAPKDMKDMYYSEDRINSVKGAIQQAIENAIEQADETGKPVYLSGFDLECAFE